MDKPVRAAQQSAPAPRCPSSPCRIPGLKRHVIVRDPKIVLRFCLGGRTVADAHVVLDRRGDQVFGQTHDIDHIDEGASWRHTADLLFLLERPVLREAFFPSGATLPVERARPADRDAILDIARIHDGDSGAAIMSEWWKQAAHMFSVARGSAGEVVGFYVMARHKDIPRSLTGCDPLLAVWLSYVQTRG